MPRSVQLNLPPSTVQKLSQARESAFPAEVNSVSPTAILVAACKDEREWQGKEDEIAARSQGYEPPYWSRIKSGDRPAQLERIGRLPVKVQKRFVRRYARALGMDVRDGTPADRQRRALLDLQSALTNAMREIG